MEELLLDSPIGRLNIFLDADAVREIDIDPGADSNRAAIGKSGPGSLAAEVRNQLGAYFDGEEFDFSVPLVMHGTAFQRRVWRALQLIPAGEVRTYGQVAAALNTSPRAVGNACRANPLPIIVPCHRVVAAAGIGGYAGQIAGRRLAIKRWLLEHEGVF